MEPLGLLCWAQDPQLARSRLNNARTNCGDLPLKHLQVRLFEEQDIGGGQKANLAIVHGQQRKPKAPGEAIEDLWSAASEGEFE